MAGFTTAARAANAATRRRNSRRDIGHCRFANAVVAADTAADPLTHWLTARYCLYAADRSGRLYRGEVDHMAWPLEPAEAVIETNTLATAAGIVLPDCPPLLHFSRRLETVAWTVEPGR